MTLTLHHVSFNFVIFYLLVILMEDYEANNFVNRRYPIGPFQSRGVGGGSISFVDECCQRKGCSYNEVMEYCEMIMF
jgi:hypothetical protein